MVAFASLTPAQQRLIRSGKAGPAKTRRPRTPTATVKEDATRWRCHRCRTIFTTWDGVAGAQPHADTTGHRRIELLLDNEGGT